MRTILILILLPMMGLAQGRFKEQLEKAANETRVDSGTVYTGIANSIYAQRHSFAKDFWTRIIFQGALDSTGYTTVVGRDTTKAFAPYSALVVLTLLQLWDGYEKDCYADSTLTAGVWWRGYTIRGDFWTPYTPRAGEMMGNILRHEKRWTHRQPSFEGFLEWLRTKSKVKE